MQSASAAIRALPALDDDLLLPDPPTTLFTRHLAPSRPIEDAELIRQNRKADYQHLFARLTATVESFKEHAELHRIEFVVLADMAHSDVDLLLGYISDVGHWCHTLAALMEPERSAIPKATWYRGRP